MMRTALLCSILSLVPTTALAQAEPREAIALIDRLNAWCASHGTACDVSERPDAHPDEAPHGEVNGMIHARRRQLDALGVEMVWSISSRRFVTRSEDDVRLVIGGSFSPDHLGPDRYEAIRARARARAVLYLAVLDRVVGTMDPAQLSSSHAPALLTLIEDVAPRETRLAARRLLALHVAALRAPPSDEYQRARLEQRIATLRLLARG